MSITSPKVSVGLPVYNGEDFVRAAIDSILGQTFTDFELIISDNGSTDRTEEICLEYAARDERVSYVRSEKNLGIAANFAKVFELSSGQYFKWAAHDDVCEPNFLMRCLDVLDEVPSVVLCYSRATEIDENGAPVRGLDSIPELGSLSPVIRFRAALGLTELFQLWGLMRADIVRKTPLLGNFVANDGPFLAGMSLFGQLHEIPEFLFSKREHEKRSGLVHSWRTPHSSIAAYDPTRVGKTIFPEWRLLAEYAAGINRVSLSWRERLSCYSTLAAWENSRKRNLLRDLILAGQHIYGIGPVLGSIYRKYLDPNAVWANRIGLSAKDVKSVIPTGDLVILVDDGAFETEAFAQWRITRLLEHDGRSWGSPPDDETAIHALDVLRESGASFVVFCWPAFWWLEHYTGLTEYLHASFECVLRNSRLVVFDLRPLRQD